jgi:hypothetical protein
MCYEIRRAEACVDYSAPHTLVNTGKLGPPPHANSFVLGPAVINTHRGRVLWQEESKRRVRVTVRSSKFVVRGKVRCFPEIKFIPFTNTMAISRS